MKRTTTLAEKLKSAALDEEENEYEPPLKKFKMNNSEGVAVDSDFFYQLGRRDEELKMLKKRIESMEPFNSDSRDVNKSGGHVTLSLPKSTTKNEAKDESIESNNSQSVLSTVGSTLLRISITSILVPSLMYFASKATQGLSINNVFDFMSKLNHATDNISQGVYVDSTGTPLAGGYNDLMYKKK